MNGYLSLDEFLENVFYYSYFQVLLRVGAVDDMQDEVGFLNFAEGGLEAVDEVGWKVLNKSNGVGDEDFLTAVGMIVVGEPYGADAGVEGGEEFIGDVDLLAGEGIEEG